MLMTWRYFFIPARGKFSRPPFDCETKVGSPFFSDPGGARRPSFYLLRLRFHFSFVFRRLNTGGRHIQMNNPLSNAELNEIVAGLKKLSRNLWWTWNQEAQDFFQDL